MPTKNAATKVDLSRVVIVDRALEIADIEGRDAITIRRLAQEFGVTPMALYWHFGNKDELLAAMGDRFFDDVHYEPEGTWTEQLSGTLFALVETLRRHPASAHLAAPRVLTCPSGQELAERVLALLREQGFSVMQATDIARTAMQTTVMLVTELAGAEPGVAMTQKEAVRTAKHDAISRLPTDRFPNLVACADNLTNCENEDEYYAFGIDFFVTAVEQLQLRLGATSSRAKKRR